MQINSAKNLTTDGCLALTVFVVYNEDTDEYLSTFELYIPEDEEGTDLAQYEAMLEGIGYASFKMEKIYFELEAILDEEDQEDEGDNENGEV